MRADQIFGILLILLAVYLALEATDRTDVDLLPLDPDFGEDSDATGSTRADDDPPATGAKAGGGLVSTRDFCAAAPDTSRFTDLGDTHDEDIRCMEAAGVVRGVSSDTYAPSDAVTRGQAASVIAAMIRESNRLEAEGADLNELPATPERRFSDVSAASPHADSIGRLNEAGIVRGFVDARYEPSQPVTRAQMATMLASAHEYLTGDAFPVGDDAFADDEASVHHESINAVAAAGITEGRTASRFEPNQSVLRGQMASFAARMMARDHEQGRIRALP